MKNRLKVVGNTSSICGLGCSLEGRRGVKSSSLKSRSRLGSASNCIQNVIEKLALRAFPVPSGRSGNSRKRCETRLGSAFWGACLEDPRRQTQQLEIADLARYLHENLYKKLLKGEGSKNASESDFVKHSLRFGGSGVDFWYRFGGAFGVVFSQIAKPSSRF